MLKTRMRAFGFFTAVSSVLAWGAFAVLTLPAGTVPSELLWLGAVVSVGATLALTAFSIMRARARNRGR